ncbi:hypothetical protein [Actinoallomurus sp. CA-142502]|uniref:hypothetical protein n=1 Tax=Actinoallomurus sp. CA-142502 TaxID=3239885 RepID=UPI003D8C1E9A
MTTGNHDDTLLSRATGSFMLLEASSTPASALEVLGSRDFGIVVTGGDPVAVVTGAGLRSALDEGISPLSSAALPPAVVADEDLTFTEFADSPGVTFLELGPPAIVLTGGGAVTAVLPVSELFAFLGSGAYDPPPDEMGVHGANDDGRLHGPPRTPSARVRCRADGCLFVNDLDYFDPRHPPPCTNPGLPPHRLRMR